MSVNIVFAIEAVGALQNIDAIQKKMLQTKENTVKVKAAADQAHKIGIMQLQQTLTAASQMGQIIGGEMGKLIQGVASVGGAAIMMYQGVVAMAAASGVGMGVAAALQIAIGGMAIATSTVSLVQGQIESRQSSIEFDQLMRKIEIW